MFNPDELYPRLKSFQRCLRENNLHNQPLYFVKVDIKSCFDTIPQKAILDHIDETMRCEEYRIMRHDEMRPKKVVEYTVNDRDGKMGRTKLSGTWVKPFIKMLHRARDVDDDENFEERMEKENVRRGSVLVDGGTTKGTWEKETLLELLERHVQKNVVKVWFLVSRYALSLGCG